MKMLWLILLALLIVAVSQPVPEDYLGYRRAFYGNGQGQ